MKHCTVYRKRRTSVCFDLYDENAEFVLGCCMDESMEGVCLLTTIENSHRLDFDQMSARKCDRRVLAILKSDWLTGLHFDLTDVHNRDKICSIKLLVTKPVEFYITIHDVEPSSLPRVRAGYASDFNCLTTSSCTEVIEDDEAEFDNKQYSSLKKATSIVSTKYYKTRSPTWNTELKLWLHNFGGRVRVPTYKCFIVIEDPAESNLDPTTVQSRIFVRHGKTSKNSYILDYREPEVSPLIALATMCAVHMEKSLVKTI